MEETKNTIFQKGSKTYYNSALFFPPDKRSDIATLYAFVRLADDYVDSIPQDRKGFFTFKNDYFAAQSTNSIIVDFKKIEKKYHFEPAWATAFLASMEMDLHNTSYATIDDLHTYLYGSSEVIGLCINRILGISPEADGYARHLGKAMQLINFIRDIDEDLGLGRVYIPKEDLEKFNISLDEFRLCSRSDDRLQRLIRSEIDRYRVWQEEAEKGYPYLPKRYRIAIKTAADMYKWTATKIYANPSIVFQEKVKPSKWFVIMNGLLNALFC